MGTESAYGWGVERWNAVNGTPFLLSHMFPGRKEAVAFILQIYGEAPNREAALRRARSQEGFRAVRVRLQRYGNQAVADKCEACGAILPRGNQGDA